MWGHHHHHRYSKTNIVQNPIGCRGMIMDPTECISLQICTKNRERYFGEIMDGQLIPTEIGQIAINYWMEIPKHYPFVSIESFVLMPDHLHDILAFYRSNKTDWIPNKFGPQSQNLGAVIGGFKSTLKRFANQNNIPFEWHRNYHDRIIRNAQEFRISNYIEANPEKW